MSSSFRDATAKPAEEVGDRIASSVHFESPQQISAIDCPRPEAGDEESDDDFEFAVVSRDSETDSSITADEIFSNGRILPVYPVFNRDLLFARDAVEEKAEEETERMPLRRLLIQDGVGRSGSTSSSSSEADDVERLAAGNYCAWTPRSVPQSPERCKKSSSTGSSKGWRLRDLVVGRSHSDGKEKFVFLAPDKERNGNSKSNPNPTPKALPATKKEGDKKGKNGKGKNGKGKNGKVAEMDMVTAHKMFYAKNGGQGQGVTGNRRSFLPYRQMPLGFFANGNSGVSLSHKGF